MRIREPALRLHKYQILGNSYLLLPPDRNPELERWAAGWPWDGDGQPGLAPGLVRRLCAADRGIGSEGLILGPLLRPGRPTALHIYNQDGTRCNFSGNAIRMVTRYLADAGAISRRPRHGRAAERHRPPCPPAPDRRPWKARPSPRSWRPEAP